MRFDRLSNPAGTLSVRMSLAILVVGCIVPLACVAAYLIFNFYHDKQEQLTRNAISQARAMIATVDRDVGGTEAALLALGSSGRLADGELRAFHAQAREALRDMNADSIVVVDQGGQLLLSTRVPFGAPLPKLSKAPLLARVLETGKPAVSNLYLGPVTGSPIYTMAVPVRRAGGGIYLLCATATPNRLSSVLSQARLPGNWRTTIIDGAHAVVARSHEMEKLLGKTVRPELIQKMNLASEGGFETTTLDSVPVIMVFSRSPTTQWSVVLGIPLGELTAELNRTLAWLIGAALAALAAGLGLAWFICRKISGSIVALIEPAIALGSGQPVPIPRLHFNEANVLGRALDAAAASLQQSQAGVRERDQWLTLTADATNLGIWIRDFVHDKIWVSDQWRALFGFSGSAPIAMEHILERVHADDRAAARLMQAEGLLEAGEYDIEYRIVLPDATLRWISSHGSVEVDQDGLPLLARGVSFDITARKRAELDVQHKQEEITHLARVTMLGELSGAITHELNQPLTAILSNAPAAQRFLAREPAELDEVREILQDIVDENKRAGEVIWRLRRLFEKHATARQSVDLNELVADVARILRNDLINHGITLQTESKLAAAPVWVDRVQFQQVLINLVINAREAMAQLAAAERVVVMRVAPADAAEVQVSIVDHGVGIAPACLEKVFEPFYTTKERGMGLGLSVCRNIVAANDGRLWGENNPGRGASFHLRMPLHAGAGASA
jgi:C4-dicarboxylate-specific signal transduction histidine kinase